MHDEVSEQPVQVLFVDDEANILKSLRRMFMDEKFEVLTATSGVEGLAVIRDNENIGLIVSDQRMPGMEGVDFLAEARKLVPGALRIILTGYADINAAMGAINKGGAFRYLTKPWQDDDLIQNIKEAVELFKLKRENVRLNAVVQKQNEMLEEWNSRLKTRVLDQTKDIRKKSESLMELNVRLKRNFEDSIHAFSNLLEMRDKSVWSHAGKVAELSKELARAKGLADDEVKTVWTAALLHDIGKISISDAVLQKSGKKLSDAELKEYRQHAIRGQAAIDAIEDLRDAGVLIRHHHERFNGSGWPDGLREDGIPVGARIIAAADFIDRMINANPMGDFVAYALQRAKEESGKRLDPDLCNIIIPATRKVYASFEPGETWVEVETDPDELLEGAILSQNIITGTGIFLLGKGHELDEKCIRAIKRYYDLDPPEQGVVVWQRK